ncbi:MAG: hypothetical protein KJO82_00115, partial [Gammaproteobacteria bacterium]|nr:hypothetical protein [Gammaproteobacteria bacterium]
AGVFTQHAPEVFRVLDDGLERVAGSFQIDGDTIGFAVDASPQAALIIDPVIEFSGYLGGSDDDAGVDIKVNGRDNVIIGGRAASVDIPGVGGAGPAATDIFMAEIDRDTGQLLWITFVGGAGDDTLGEFEFDSQGNIIGVGATASSDFPTVNAFQSTYAGGGILFYDGVVFKLNDDGSQFLFSTYYGGMDLDDAKFGYEFLSAIHIDASDNILIAGSTAAPDFPVTGAFRGRACMETDINSVLSSFVSDIVLLEFAPDGTRLFATCIGGTERDVGVDVEIGPDGRAFVGAYARSSDMPTSADAFQVEPGSYSGLILKLNQTRSDIEWASYVGGSATDFLYEMKVLSNGAVAGVGNTASSDFPATALAVQSSPGDPGDFGDAMVFRLSADGTALEYGTFFGGSLYDAAEALRVDDRGRYYLVGETWSRDMSVRTPLDVPDPLVSGFVDVVPGRVANDMHYSRRDFGTGDLETVIFAARNGTNQLYREVTEDNWIAEDLDTQIAESVAVVPANFLGIGSGADIAFINRFAPNKWFTWSDNAYAPGPDFGSADRDSRDAGFINGLGLVGRSEIVIANYGQPNQIFVDGTTPMEIGRVDGNTVAVIVAFPEYDIFFANEGQDIRLYRDPSGAAEILSTTSPHVSVLAVGDIDGDQYKDLIIGNNPGPVQVVTFPDGQPSAVEDLAGVGGGAATALFLFDIEDDGDLDLIVGRDGFDGLYLNDGSGVFSEDPFPSVDAVTFALTDTDTCSPACYWPVYAAEEGGIKHYRTERGDLFVAVIDPATGTLEFSTYLTSGSTDRSYRGGIELFEGGALLLAGTAEGSAWPVVGAAQGSPGGGSDAVFMEIDLDIDDDGALDGSDNCLDIANPMQRDTDDDAYGNLCDPDLNNDGAVNFADLQLFKQRFFSDDPDADLNGDGIVNFTDLQITKAFIFGPPGPSGLLLP